MLILLFLAGLRLEMSLRLFFAGLWLELNIFLHD